MYLNANFDMSINGQSSECKRIHNIKNERKVDKPDNEYF